MHQNVLKTEIFFFILIIFHIKEKEGDDSSTQATIELQFFLKK